LSAQEGGGGQEKEEKGKVYTIRGLDPELYERFSRTAKELGVTVGDLMNMAMSNLLVTLEASKDVGQRVSSALSRILDKIKEAQAAAMKTVVGAVADFDLISDIDELTVTKADLQAAERPIVFSNIKRLVFHMAAFDQQQEAVQDDSDSEVHAYMRNPRGGPQEEP